MKLEKEKEEKFTPSIANLKFSTIYTKDSPNLISPLMRFIKIC